jgi:hypothetical protein
MTITFVVMNPHRAVIYAGTDASEVTSALGRDRNNYAEAWRDGQPLAAWDRNMRLWLSTDTPRHEVIL